MAANSSGKYTHFSGVDATLFKINGTQVTTTAADLNKLSSLSSADAITLSSNAGTMTKRAAVVTSESLTTAAGASQAMTITKTGVVAGDLVFITRAGGTNTRRSYAYDAVTTTDTITVTVYNNEPTNALNGTLKFNVLHIAK